MRFQCSGPQANSLACRDSEGPSYWAESLITVTGYIRTDHYLISTSTSASPPHHRPKHSNRKGQGGLDLPHESGFARAFSVLQPESRRAKDRISVLLLLCVNSLMQCAAGEAGTCNNEGLRLPLLLRILLFTHPCYARNSTAKPCPVGVVPALRHLYTISAALPTLPVPSSIEFSPPVGLAFGPKQIQPCRAYRWTHEA